MRSVLVLALMIFVAGCVTTDYNAPATTTVRTTALTTVQPTTIQASTAPAALDVKISFVELPDSVKPNSKFAVKWKVDSNQQKNITHTAVHYGNKSVSGALATEVTPADSGYTDLTAISTDSKIPNEFSLSVFTKSQGTIYARGHVIVDEKNYWTEEKSIKVE